ncbi:MAG: hypothetical protein IID48_21105 [Proteobacteria bacterium]|nr:hypothetical protein [Pseudomonadota bacterium]
MCSEGRSPLQGAFLATTQKTLTRACTAHRIASTFSRHGGFPLGQKLRILGVNAHPHDFTHYAGTLGIHVEAGDEVTEGQTLLIIEAMKVMNPLAAPHAGTVARILVSDGQPVEFGEPLLIVD